MEQTTAFRGGRLRLWGALTPREPSSEPVLGSSFTLPFCIMCFATRSSPSSDGGTKLTRSFIAASCSQMFPNFLIFFFLIDWFYHQMKRKEIKVLTILHWEVVDFNFKKKKKFWIWIKLLLWFLTNHSKQGLWVLVGLGD